MRHTDRYGRDHTREWRTSKGHERPCVRLFRFSYANFISWMFQTALLKHSIGQVSHELTGNFSLSTSLKSDSLTLFSMAWKLLCNFFYFFSEKAVWRGSSADEMASLHFPPGCSRPPMIGTHYFDEAVTVQQMCSKTGIQTELRAGWETTLRYASTRTAYQSDFFSRHVISYENYGDCNNGYSEVQITGRRCCK